MKHFGMQIISLILSLLILGSAAAQNITMAMGAQPETFDPQVTAATSSFQVAKSVYDTLVEANRSGEIVPALAESWEISDDGLTWTFQLRSGVMFHDGSELDSEDVRATLERIMSDEIGSPKASEFTSVERIDTLDENTVALHLSAPTPALLATLASGWGAILPSEKVESDHDFGNSPVGTGPFKLDQWVRDSHVQLSRFDDYYAGAPELMSVTIRFIADSAVQMQGLLAGEFDIIDEPAPSDYPMIEGNAGLVLVQDPSGLVNVASLNIRRPHLSDVRVRQALNYAVDKELVLEVAYGGGVLVGTFMEAGSPWSPEDVEPYPYDPERARVLLQEASVPDNWTIDLVLPQPYDRHITAGQMIQSMFSDVGVNAEIRIVEWGVWLGEIFGGPRDFDVTIVGHTGKLDPTGRLASYDTADSNYVGFEDPEVTEQLHRASVSADWDERSSLYADVLRRLNEEPPFVYLGTPFTTYAHKGTVDGFWITPLLDSFDFRDVNVN
jgi:peptide/nickel transport system substrate-binding protein